MGMPRDDQPGALAPLVTMTEEPVLLGREATADWWRCFFGPSLMRELDAQRRLRLAERRQAFEEAIAVVFKQSYALEHVNGERCDTEQVVAALEVARDAAEGEHDA